MASRTAAHALHDVLEDLRQAKQKSIQAAWAEVLGATVGTADFARRHAEVVSLWAATRDDIAGLPSERSRERFEPYLTPWWNAVMATQVQWNAGIELPRLITDEHLHLLGSAGDIIEHSLEGSVAAPTSDDLEPLRLMCTEWIQILTNDRDIPGGLRLSLLESLRHVLWLIDNADRFGLAPIATASQSVVGGLMLAAPHVSEESSRTWTDKIKRFTVVLATLAGFLAAGQQVIESGQGLVGAIASVVQSAQGDSDSDADVVDAEVVEDDPDDDSK